MPELAEVETVRNYLKNNILNKRIIDVKVLYPKMIENDLNYFKTSLINNSFIDIKRKGKYLIFETNDFYMISHLRMEGKYNIRPLNDEISKHEHVIFYFEDFTLRYDDTRKFGRMKIIEKSMLDSYFANVGPDANSDFNYEDIIYKIQKSNKSIKTILLDQSIISGIGNIYADEILYDAKINPLIKGNNLSKEDINRILSSSKKILNDAIKHKGTTIKSFTSSYHQKGEYQNFLKVHTKKICPCGNEISKVKIDGRSSYFCKNCQK